MNLSQAAGPLYKRLELSSARGLLRIGPVQNYRAQHRGVRDMDAASVIRLIAQAGGASVACHVVGGWGVDALVGRQTRLHDDLDLAYESHPGSARALHDALAAIGYRLIRVQEVPDALFPIRVLFSDGSGRSVDLLPMCPFEPGAQLELPPGVVEQTLPALGPAAFVPGHVGERRRRVTISCLDPLHQLSSRQNYELRRSDHHDIGVLVRRDRGASKTPRLSGLAQQTVTRAHELHRQGLMTATKVSDAVRGSKPDGALVVPVPVAAYLVAMGRAGLRLPPSELPPHITLLYPFAPPGRVSPAVEERLLKVFSQHHPFDFDLHERGQFPGVTWLRPRPADAFVELAEELHRSFPEYPPYEGAFDTVIPHLTLVPHDRLPRPLERSVDALLPVRSRATEVLLLGRPAGGRWAVQDRFGLGNSDRVTRTR